MTKRRPGPRRNFHEPGDWNDKGEPTATVAEVICRELERGLPQEMAAQCAGVPWATMKYWITDGRRLIRRQHLEADFAPTDAESELMDFVTAMSTATAAWVARANQVMEASMLSRRRVTIKHVWEVTKDPDTGAESLVELERHVTEVTEPIDTTPIQWRLSKIAPQVYSATPRFEQESEAGESEQIDIAARVNELMAKIANTLVLETGEDSDIAGV